MLDAATAGDAPLRALVERLLAADAEESPLDAEAGHQVAAALHELDAGTLQGRVGSFRVLREIGRGGMGVVYEAEQDLPRRRVALKTLPASQRAPEALARFRVEVQAAAQLEHPFVPRVYEVLEHDGLPVVAMELVRGEDARAATRGWSLERRLRLLRDVARTVDALHEEGVLHRDLKPSNVLVTERGEPRVLDFGIAALGAEDGPVAGTPAYMAPEIRLGASSARASDVFSLGALGAEVLADRPLDLHEPVRGRILDAGLPRPLTAVLHRACAPTPDARYATAAAFADELQRLLDGHLPEAFDARPADRLRAFVQRRRTALLAAGTVALVAVGVTVGFGWASWQVWRAEVTQAAEAELAALQALAATQGAEAPSVAEAFETLVRDADVRGTPVESAAWRWWHAAGPPSARRRAAAMAWVTAVDPEDEAAGAQALARQLAEERAWAQLSAVLHRLEVDAPALAVREALGRHDLRAAEGMASGRAAALLAALGTATPFPGTRDQGAFVDGGTLRLEDDRLGVFGSDGAVSRSWPRPASARRWSLAGVHDGRAWLWGEAAPDAGGRRRDLYAVDLAGGDLVQVEQVDQPVVGPWFADRDGDGVAERYLSVGLAGQPLHRADPALGPSRPVGRPMDQVLLSQGTVHDLDGDGADALVFRRRGRREGVEVWTEEGFRGRIRVDGGRVTGLPGGDLLVAGHAYEGFVHGASLDATRTTWLARARWTGEGFALVGGTPLSEPIGALRTADLDGDGLLEVVAESDLGTLLLWEDGGTWSQLLIPDLRPVAVGQGDADPADELWVVGDDWRGLLGAGEGPLPTRTWPEPPPPARVGRRAFGAVGTTWARAEALAALGLVQEAARVFDDLGRFAGPVSTDALRRRMALLAPVDAPSALASARELLDRGALEPVSDRAVLEALRSTQDLEVLAAVDPAGPWRGLVGGDRAPEVLVSRGRPLPDGWTVHRPALVDAAGGDLAVRTFGPEAGLASLSLDEVGDVLVLTVDLEVAEQDFGTGLDLRLATEGWETGLYLGRGNSGPASVPRHTLWCGGFRKGAARSRPFAPGRHRLTLSWVRPSGHLRCQLDDLVIVHPEAGPPAGRSLRLSVGTGAAARVSPGLLHARLVDVRVTGATRVPTAPDDATLAARGDVRQLARRAATGTPLEAAVLGARLAGPAAVPDGLDARGRRALLRFDPVWWTPPLAEATGDAFAAHWWEAWRQPLAHGAPALEAAVRAPATWAVMREGEAWRSLRNLRARVLTDDGDLGAAQAVLALDAPDDVEGLYQRARVLQRLGRPAQAVDHLREAVALSEDPGFLLDRLAGDRWVGSLVDQVAERPPRVDQVEDPLTLPAAP